MALLIWILIIVVVAIVAFLLVDKGFTGPAAEFAWIAKLIIVVIALLALWSLVSTGGLMPIRL